MDKARIANEAKNVFLADISDKMRTPLNAIIGLAWLSLETDACGANHELEANLGKIHSAGTALLDIVNDILDISKIESGKMTLAPVDYDTPSLINDTVTQNLMWIGEKPIELKLELDANLYSRLYGDEIRIKQIMNSLLSNAIKFTGEGEVILTISCEHDEEAVWLTVKVQDTGQGINPEDIENLYDAYFKADMQPARKTVGAGLGLFITKNLCELMGGSITVESEPGKGTVFTARMKQGFITDVVIGPETVASLSAFHYTYGRRKREIRLKRISLPYAHVLIVDDNLTNLDVAKGLMRPYGMQITCVDGGQKAINAVQANEGKYDAVFMDQMMPGMDGIEATRRIRELPAAYAKNVPIIALTANSIVGNEEMFLSKGFQAFLSKPIDIKRLDTVVRQWIRDKEKELVYVGLEALEDEDDTPKALISDKSVEGLDIYKGIDRFDGDEESYITVLRSYASNTRNYLATIQNVNAHTLRHYEITVHGIKGSSLGICADALGDMARDLEGAAKAGDFDYIAKHNPIFLEAAWKFISDLEAVLAAIEAENPKPKKDKPSKEVLLHLLEACDEYNMDGVDEAMAEITAYEYEYDDGLAEWLRLNVDLMNFTEIVEKLSSLDL